MSTTSPGIFAASLPEFYERSLVGPLFRPFAEDLIERLAPAPGERVVDIACGTGIVARLARERVGATGRVVGIDASVPMLEVAARVAPGIEWRRGSADALPVSDEERFDVVCCQQGIQFFPDKTAAAREMRRIAAPGGRVGISTWLGLDDVPMFRDLHEIAVRHLGPVVDSRHSFGDADALRRLAVDAGFRDVQLSTVSRPIRASEPPLFARMNTMAIVGMSAAAKAMTDEQRARVAAEITAESEDLFRRSYVDGDEIVFDLATNVLVARA